MESVDLKKYLQANIRREIMVGHRYPRLRDPINFWVHLSQIKPSYVITSIGSLTKCIHLFFAQGITGKFLVPDLATYIRNKKRKKRLLVILSMIISFFILIRINNHEFALGIIYLFICEFIVFKLFRLVKIIIKRFFILIILNSYSENIYDKHIKRPLDSYKSLKSKISINIEKYTLGYCINMEDFLLKKLKIENKIIQNIMRYLLYIGMAECIGFTLYAICGLAIFYVFLVFFAFIILNKAEKKLEDFIKDLSKEKTYLEIRHAYGIKTRNIKYIEAYWEEYKDAIAFALIEEIAIKSWKTYKKSHQKLLEHLDEIRCAILVKLFTALNSVQIFLRLSRFYRSLGAMASEIAFLSALSARLTLSDTRAPSLAANGSTLA